MKRKLTLVVCVIAAIAMMFTLASCGGNGDHEHTYAQEWSSNEYGHWYAATCGCEGETANYGAHVDADKNGVCDTCAYVTCTHTYETDWQSDNTHHWNNSSCGCNVKGSYGEHVDADKNGVCDTCAYVVCAHEYADEWSSDGENHWHEPTCGCEVAGKDLAKHVDKVFDGVCDVCQTVICAHVDADKDGVCDDCTYVMCTHEYADEWSSDATNHWYAATCGCEVTNGLAAHFDVMGGVNGGKNGLCDACGYVVCAHTFKETYTTTLAHHWYEATCGCDVIDAKAEHTDEDIDGVCEVCFGKTCEHTYEEELSSDETGHWYAATCGCEVKKDFAEHTPVVSEKTSDCEVCKYVICEEHKYTNEWSLDGEKHWHVSTCGCDTIQGEENHEDLNKDGNCDDCEFVMCAHTYVTDKLSSNEGYHWFDSTCGCYVNKDKTEHVDNDDNGECDDCQYVSSVKDAIESLDSTASDTTNSTVADVNTYNEYSGEVNSEISYKVYDNYIVEKDSYGNVTYYSYYGTAGNLLFVIQISEYGTRRNEEAVEPEAVASYYIANNSISADNNEDRIKAIYELGVSDSAYGFAGSYDEATKTYSMSYLFVDESWDGTHYYVVETSYVAGETINADKETIYGVASAIININEYSAESVTLNPGADTYEVAEGAVAVMYEKYTITQTFGEPMDSTNNPNPYPASDYIVSDFTLTDGVTTYNDGDTIKLDAMEQLVLNFNQEIAGVIKFNTITVTATASNGTQLSSWSSVGTININTYEDSRPITFVGKQADTFTITVEVEGITKTLTAEVSYLTPEYIDSVVYNEEGTKVTTDSYTIYSGQTLKITSSVAYACDPSFTATLPADAAAAITNNNDGTWTFTPVMAGEFEITLTSTVDANVSTVLTVTVAEPPAIGDVLNGVHTYSDMSSDLSLSATFTPTEEGAETGTVVITVNGTMFSYVTYEWLTIDYSATYTYAYNSETGDVDLTYVEGDVFDITLLVDENYKVIAIYDYTDYKLVQQVVKVDPTTDFTFTITGANTYAWDATVFTFVAGAAGEYTFTVPAGVGVMDKASYDVNPFNTLPYVDYNAAGGTFTLDLAAGEVVELYVTSTEAGTHTIDFEAPEALAGSGTSADPYVLTEGTTIDIDYAAGADYIYYTFTPDAAGTLTITVNDDFADFDIGYGIFDFNLTNSMFSPTATQAVEAGQTVYLKFSTYSGEAGQYSVTLAYESEGGEDEPTEAIKDANGLGGDYTFTFVMEYTLTFTPDSEGATSGTLTVTDPINTQYSGDYAYTIVEGAYVFESKNATITQDVGGNWLFQNPGMARPQQFATAE